MKFYGLLLTMFFLSNFAVFSQEKIIKHTVSKGETIFKIAKEYQVSVNEIYELNPSSKKGIQIKAVLLIPNKNQNNLKSNPEITVVSNTINHKVLPKETIYGLSKKYNISSEVIYQYNPTLATNGLKVDQELKIPNTSFNNEESIVSSTDNASIKSEVVSQSQVVTDLKVEDKKSTDYQVIHEVQPKETKYRIAKEYGISVADLEKLNPEVKKNLPIGYKLNIITSKYIAPKNSVIQEDLVENEPANQQVKSSENIALVDQLISSASENIGTRYKTGGTSKEGFDCSGLMYTTFGLFNIKLPRSSYEQAQYGEEIKAEEAQKGDLIFFKTSRRKQINHVGMVVEVKDGDIKFIHSSVKGGVMISSVKEKYYASKVSQINRVL